MNFCTFEKIIEERLKHCVSLLSSKGKEYNSGGESPFNSFFKASEIQGCTPEQALAGMMAKHTVSIYDMIESGEEYPLEKWEEKITDHINYLLILYAMEADEQEGTEEHRCYNCKYVDEPAHCYQCVMCSNGCNWEKQQ